MHVTLFQRPPLKQALKVRNINRCGIHRFKKGERLDTRCEDSLWRLLTSWSDQGLTYSRKIMSLWTLYLSIRCCFASGQCGVGPGEPADRLASQTPWWPLLRHHWSEVEEILFFSRVVKNMIIRPIFDFQGRRVEEKIYNSSYPRGVHRLGESLFGAWLCDYYNNNTI